MIDFILDGVEWVQIEREDGSTISMTKANYDEQQAQASQLGGNNE